MLRSADAEAGGNALAVSVVIPTCDRPAQLERALASVRAQTLAPAEMLVVDDGRVAAARPRPTAGLRVIANRHARGPSGARNCGAAQARSPLLAFLDDDDEWLPTYLATVVAHVSASSLDVACTDLLYRYDDEGEEGPGKTAPAVLDPQAFLTHNPGLIGSNVVIRAAAYAAIGGFDESLQAAEDMDFGIRLGRQAGLRYAPLRQRLVVHHHHRQARLCTRRGAAMRAGIARFFALHGARMDAPQRAEFRRAMQRLWGIDEYGRDLEGPP